MEQKELKEKLIKIIIGVDQGEPYWEVADKIVALIAPVPDTDSKEQWEVIEYRHVPTSEALGKPVILSDTNSKYWEKAKNDPEYSINAVKVGNEIYRCGDKIKWRWDAENIPQQYVTITKFELRTDKSIPSYKYNNKLYNGLYVEIAENDTAYYIENLAKDWGLSHYQVPEPVQEEKIGWNKSKPKWTPEEQEYINHKNPWYYVEKITGMSQLEITKAIEQYKASAAPVEKEPEVVLTVEQRIDRLENMLRHAVIHTAFVDNFKQ